MQEKDYHKDEIDIYFYLSIIWKRKFLILGLTALLVFSMSIAMFIDLLRNKEEVKGMYNISVLLTNRYHYAINSRVRNYREQNYIDTIQNIILLIKSNAFNNAVRESLGLEKDKNLRFKAIPVTLSFKGREISKDSKEGTPLTEKDFYSDKQFLDSFERKRYETGLIEVSYTTKNIEEGKRILYELIDQVNNYYKDPVHIIKEEINLEIFKLERDRSRLENSKKTIANQKAAISNQREQIEFQKIKMEIEKEHIQRNRQRAVNNRLLLVNKKNIIINNQDEVKYDQALSGKEAEILKEKEKEILESSKNVEENTRVLTNQWNLLLNDNKDGADALSLLMYSNTIQQNIQYLNNLNTELTDLKLEREEAVHQIEILELEMNRLDTQLDNIDIRLINEDLSLEDIEEKLKQKDIEIKINELKLKDIEKKIRDQDISSVDRDLEIHYITQKIKNLEFKMNRIQAIKLVSPPVAKSIERYGSGYGRVKKKLFLSGAFSLFITTLLAFFLEYLELSGKRTKERKALM